MRLLNIRSLLFYDLFCRYTRNLPFTSRCLIIKSRICQLVVTVSRLSLVFNCHASVRRKTKHDFFVLYFALLANENGVLFILTCTLCVDYVFTSIKYMIHDCVGKHRVQLTSRVAACKLSSTFILVFRKIILMVLCSFILANESSRSSIVLSRN